MAYFSSGTILVGEALTRSSRQDSQHRRSTGRKRARVALGPVGGVGAQAGEGEEPRVLGRGRGRARGRVGTPTGMSGGFVLQGVGYWVWVIGCGLPVSDPFFVIDPE